MNENFLNDPVKVLHLDDEPDILMITKRFVEHHNKEAIIQLDYNSINNPVLIFDKLKEEKFDVIVADYEMPEMNGLEVLNKLRTQLKNDIPFIIFTGRGREEVAIKALNLGANYYINKGLDFESQYHELFHAIQSVTKQKRTEEAFHENEEKYRGLVENLPIIVLILDKLGKILFANHVIPPYKLEETIGTCFFDYMDEEHVSSTKKAFFKSITYETITRGEYKTKIGNFIDARFIPMKKSNEINQIMVITDVITKRKEMENFLRESEEKFRSLFEQTPIAQAERDYSFVKKYLLELEEKGVDNLKRYLELNPKEVFKIARMIKLTMVNEAALKLMEVSTRDQFEDLIPLKYLDQPKPLEGFIRQLINIHRGKLEQSNSVFFLTGKGNKKFVNIVHVVPSEYKESFARVWTKYIDVTDLHESERKTQSIINVIPDMIFQFNKKGDYINYLGNVNNLLIPPRDFLGKNVSEILPKPIADLTKIYIEKTLKEKKTQYFEYSLEVDKKLRRYEARMIVYTDNNVLAIVREEEHK